MSAAETLIFDDEFNNFNLSTWQHEITMGGGGNWEFEYYTNNRTNSFVKDGILHLQPTLSEDTFGLDTIQHGDINLWGGSPADQCTSNAFYGCERNAAASGNFNNPIQSARIRSVNSFSFKYGRVEIRAKLPKGDWIWPAIWMLPKYNSYGQWPASGEIDIVESRGNDPSCPNSRTSFGSTLHWGPGWPYDAWDKAHADYTSSTDLSADFHLYGLEWTANGIKTTIDGAPVLDFPFDQDLFTKGGFPNVNNPWQYETENSAPFNQEFYLIFNVAVGGTNAYFPDGACGKPWSNNDPHAVNAFYNAKGQWYSTWNYPATHDSAMQIDYVKVWQEDSAEPKDVSFLQQ
jgi:beta-glucanase (GH16 family)